MKRSGKQNSSSSMNGRKTGIKITLCFLDVTGLFLGDLEIAVEYWRVRVPLLLSVELIAQFWNVDPLPRNESRTRGAKSCFGGLYLPKTVGRLFSCGWGLPLARIFHFQDVAADRSLGHSPDTALTVPWKQLHLSHSFVPPRYAQATTLHLCQYTAPLLSFWYRLLNTCYDLEAG